MINVTPEWHEIPNPAARPGREGSQPGPEGSRPGPAHRFFGPARPRCKNRPGRISAARPGRGQNLLARLGRKFLNGPRRAGPAHSVSRHNAKLSTVMYISIFPCIAELNPSSHHRCDGTLKQAVRSWKNEIRL